MFVDILETWYFRRLPRSSSEKNNAIASSSTLKCAFQPLAGNITYCSVLYELRNIKTVNELIKLQCKAHRMSSIWQTCVSVESE